MTDKQKTNITLGGTITAVNSGFLLYFFNRLNCTDECIEKESKYSKMIRRNLNLLNMKFKTNIVDTELNNLELRKDIDELRKIIMHQNDNIENLENIINKNISTDRYDVNNTSTLTYDKLSCYSTPKIPQLKTDTGNKTINIYE